MAFAVPLLAVATTAIGTTAIGTGLQAAGSIAGAVAQRQQGRTALLQARAEEQAARRRLLQRYGSARTHFAAAGITPDGSASDTLDDIVQDGELEALSLRYQGRLADNAARGAANRAILGAASQAFGSLAPLIR